MKEPRSILITGASSGIGEALALAYAAPGMSLALSGRDRDRLDAVALRCRELGAVVEAKTVDVVDEQAMARWIGAVDERAPLDLVIANAGVSRGLKSAGEIHDHVREIFAVNVEGVFNTLHPAIPRMRARGQGQLAIMSSFAGFRGLPGAAAYCASKAAVKVYGEGLRGWLQPKGVEVSVVCPGFVRSRLTARNKFAMPFLMDAERAARIIKRGLRRNKGLIAFPLPMHAFAWLLAALPATLLDPLLRRLPAKK